MTDPAEATGRSRQFGKGLRTIAEIRDVSIVVRVMSIAMSDSCTGKIMKY